MQYYDIIHRYGGGSFPTRSIFTILCFLFLLFYIFQCIFPMRFSTGLQDTFRHQAPVLPRGWCSLCGSLCGFINNRDWTRCPQLVLCVVGIPIYVKVPHQGFRYLGSGLCVFDSWLPMGCQACWYCAGDGIEVAKVTC